MNSHVYDGVAQSYDVFRPRYPETLLYAITNFWGVDRMPTVVDVGCGTGISSRAIYHALRGECTIIGVDINMDMLATARAGNTLPIAYVQGRAEALPPEVLRADIITAGQSAQWFDRDKFYRECLRVLPANGTVAIYENNRDWKNSPFLQAHEAFLEEFSIDPATGRHYSRHYRANPYTQEIGIYFDETIEKKLHWATRMKVADFYRMACTSTKFIRAQKALGEAATRRLFYSYADLFTDRFGMVTVDYVTRLYAGRGPRF